MSRCAGCESRVVVGLLAIASDAARRRGCGSLVVGSGEAARRASPAPAYPGIDLANTRFVAGPDRQRQRRRAEARLETADRRAKAPSALRPPRRSSAAASSTCRTSNRTCRRSTWKPAKCSGTNAYERARPGPERGHRRRRQGLRRDPDRGLRARPGNRQGALVDEADAQRAREAIDMAPGLPRRAGLRLDRADQRRPPPTTAAAPGSLWALDAKTGKKVWHFDTVPNGLWSKKHKTINAGGGLWYAPSFDEEGRDVRRGRQPGAVPGRPRQLPWGAEPARPRTSTPTRWSSSTRRPASSSGTTS